MRALYYDTETTGLPLHVEPDEDVRQPRVVQIAALLVDTATWTSLGTLGLVIQPDIPIPEEATRVHGITNELAAQAGVSEDTAMRAFLALWRRAEIRVGHNEAFDARIISIAIARRRRADRDWGGSTINDRWNAGRAACTARLMTPHLKIPATERMEKAGRGGQFKTPNLGEAFQFVTGQALKGGHNAMVDAMACMDVHRWIMGRTQA